MVTLIITEKPSVCLKIATALADKKVEKKLYQKVPYYELTHKGKKIIVVCAVGHLYTVAKKDKKWGYPILNYTWEPTYSVSKTATFTKPYLELIKKEFKQADEFIVGCDMDAEGEVIGYNILKHIIGKEDAMRMQYSTTTSEDLLKSYENVVKHIDKKLVESGLTRHELDFMWGLSISSALTISIKNATKMFKVMSSGRVQGPTLHLLYKKEEEIRKFKSEPFWEIYLKGILNGKNIDANYKKGIFKDKKKADEVLKHTKNKPAYIEKISKKEFKQNPLLPFDLTTLQIDAHRLLGLSPKVTLEIAQMLYVNSYISYPRTSSQKLPESINYKGILNKLKGSFPKEVEFILSKKILKPTEGNKTDPAHPAIYPTGIIPKKLNGKAEQVYELIVRRFFVCFGDPALRETVSYNIDCNGELFEIKGTLTKEKGWHTLYGKFAKFKEEELPSAREKDEIKKSKVISEEKETQPPKRYSEASLIKELESHNLGTKATRADIISTLLERDYVNDKDLKVTNLGMKTIETLKKYCPEILDEKLTREFEEDMEEIREGKNSKEKVLANAKKTLTEIFKKFKENELKIGKSLGEANIETRIEESTISECPVCKKGTLRIRRGKFGNFIACSDYPNCKTTFSLPNNALIKPTKKVCEKCRYPMVDIIKKGKRPQTMCINPKCPTRKLKEKLEDIKDLGKKCPECKKGKLILRKGFYGSFLACDQYPTCKYTESINGKKKKKKK